MKCLEEWVNKYIDSGTGCAIIVVFLMLVVGVVMLAINLNKCSKRYKSIQGVFDNDLLIKSKKKYKLIMIYIKRCETYYNSFFMWQLISKIINILCLTCTFLSIAPGKNDDTAKVISVIGFLCITSQIYLNPSKRAEQYLNAWREGEYHLLRVLGDTGYDDDGIKPDKPSSRMSEFQEASSGMDESPDKSDITDAAKNIELIQGINLKSTERETMITRINKIPKMFKKIENSISSDAE